nr:hypothetical protein [Tanacetum cinerariifolium]
MTTSVENNSVFKCFFEKQKLTGSNFIDWYRQLRLVLSTEDKKNYLEHHIPAAPVALPGQQVPPEALAAHAAWVKGQKKVVVLMLLTMDLEIQRNLAHLGTYDMLQELKAMYSKQAEQELLQTMREFHICKQEEGQSVSSHVLKMNGYIDNLERLSQPVGQNLALSLFLVSLNKDFYSFVQNYNMHGMGKIVNELHAMLKLHEETLPKKDPNPALHAILTHPPPKKDNPAKDAICHQYGEVGNWKRNCPVYLTELMKNKKLSQGASTLVSKNNLVYFMAVLLDGIFEINISCSNTNDSSIKMARKPYSHQVERANDLLGLIYTDVCGPFKTVSRQEASYFVTFIDDFSHLELIQEEDTNPSVDTSLNHEGNDQEIDEPQSDINPIRRSTRTPRPTDRLCLYIDAEEHELWDLGEPANYKAALLDPESKKWLDAMNVEMQSMKDNDVWVLVELPPNTRTVGSMWLFKKKTDMDGAIYVFKARLVAKGFTQTYGVDYEETFFSVVDIRGLRILIAIAAYYDYEIWQMDVKTSFLNGHLFEEVYMEQPDSFVNPKYPNHQFDDEIEKFDFTQTPDEPCVYLKASGSYVAILILYVDDILLMGNNIPMLQDVKSYIRRSFAMKDLGDAAYILGIKIYRDRSKRLISLCQSAYIEKILKRYYMKNSKRGTIPMQEKLKLSKSQGASTPVEKQRIQNIPYASANPGEEHWTAVKNILKYLRNTKDMFLVYGGNIERELRFSCYTDAGYLRDAENLKSRTGYVIVPTIEEPISMYCDNIEAITIAKDNGVTKGTRHFRVKVHYLRETIKLGDVKIEKIDTDDNLADPFKKPLAVPKHSELTRNIRLLPASIIIEYLLKISKKAHILELKRRHFKGYCSDILYDVSIKEDTAYLCLHFTKDHKGNMINTPYPEKTNMGYSSYGNKIFWKISNVVPTPKNP